MTTHHPGIEDYWERKSHLGNSTDQSYLDAGTEIDFDAVRARMEFVGLVYSEPLYSFPEPCDPKDVKRLVKMTDRSLSRLSYAMPFIKKYGLSFEWLYFGDVKELLIDARKLSDVVAFLNEDRASASERADFHMREFTKAMCKLSEEKGAAVWSLQAHERTDESSSDVHCCMTIEHPTPPTKEGGREGWIAEEVKVELSAA